MKHQRQSREYRASLTCTHAQVPYCCVRIFSFSCFRVCLLPSPRVFIWPNHNNVQYYCHTPYTAMASSRVEIEICHPNGVNCFQPFRVNRDIELPANLAMLEAELFDPLDQQAKQACVIGAVIFPILVIDLALYVYFYGRLHDSILFHLVAFGSSILFLAGACVLEKIFDHSSVRYMIGIRM